MQSVDEDVVVVVVDVVVVVSVAVVVVDAAVVVGSRKFRRPRPFFGNGIDGSVARDMTPRSQCVVVDVVVVIGSSVVGSSRQMIPCCSVVGISSVISNPLRTHATSMSIRAQIEYESPGSNLFNDEEQKKVIYTSKSRVRVGRSSKMAKKS